MLALILLSELSMAWLLYVGLIFLFMVMYAPGGLASLIMMNLRVASFGKLRKMGWAYLALSVTAFAALLGGASMVEMIYHLQLNAAVGPELKFMGMTLNATQPGVWMGCGLLFLVGLALFELARRKFRTQWSRVQDEIETEIKRRELL